MPPPPDDAAFHPATVRRAWDETVALRALELAVPELVLESHHRAGQYLRTRTGSAAAFFAIASAPGHPIELLVKRAGGVAASLVAFEPGDRLEVSAVAGHGFPLDESIGHDLLLFAAGSGISPIRALIGQVLAERERYGRVLLFYGHRRSGDFAYQAEQAIWARAGVEVVRVVSEPAPDWRGAVGYVQDALLAARPDVGHATAFLGGMREMVTGVSETLTALGIDPARIHTNV